MDKIPTDISTTVANSSTINPTEKRSLSQVMNTTKRSGGNYGSLAKSQLQPTFYICHQVEPDDTMQRLTLKYSVNIQEIKRVNKLWSDAELILLENVYIPVNSQQLTTLRTLYPSLNIVQSLSPTTNHSKKSLPNATTDDEPISSMSASDSSVSLTTNDFSYQDYLSKIDQQIRTSKKSLQAFDAKKQYPKHRIKETSSPTSQQSNGNTSDESTSSQNGRTTFWNNGRHKGNHHSSDNNIFVNITQNSREKHVSAALERIQREKDDNDEL